MVTHRRDEGAPTGWPMVLALLVLTALLSGPAAVIETTANPPPSGALAAANAEPPGLGAPMLHSVPSGSDDVGPFAFGYVEFDWDPRAPGGVPGFDSWPPASPPRRSSAN